MPAADARRPHPWLLVAGLVLVALNLRPALTSLSPLLTQVQQGLGLSATAAGLLTSLPVLCLGLFAPLAPRLAQRFDAERTIFGLLFVLAIGTALRGVFGSFGLFAGTLLAGAAIGVVGTLLPSLIKRDYAARAGTMTGLYTMALCLGAGAAAGLSVPLRNLLGGWRQALACWALFALLAALAWWPQVRRKHREARSPRLADLWRNRVAWAVTLYLGLQSSLAYAMFGWLPAILVDRGASPLDAGLMLSVEATLQFVTAFIGPWLAMRFGKDQRPTLLLMLSVALAGLFGVLYAPLTHLWPWIVLLGLGQGGQFGVAMLLIVVRSPNTQRAAQLSGMAQGIGYLVAGLGPLALGLLHDMTGGWDAAGALFVAITAAAMTAGWAAGQNRLIDPGWPADTG